MKRFLYIIHIVSETIPTAEKKLLDLLFLGVISLQTTILGKIFAYFFTFYKTFPSSQLKRDQIIFTREWMYELPQELPRTFSPMGGLECQGSYRQWAGLSAHTIRIDGQYPACLPKGKFWQLYYISCNTSCNTAKTQL